MISNLRDGINMKMFIDDELFESHRFAPLNNLFISECYECNKVSIWVQEKIIYPKFSTDIEPNPDMPEKVKELFEEAKLIVNDSPKGSAALLRLAVEHLCIDLSAKGGNLDKKIAFLVSKGLNENVQQALDSLRVIGNEAVHPGKINLDDNKTLALELFELLNFICDDMITRKNRIKKVYNTIPETKRKGIEDRDKGSKSKENG